MTDAQSFTSKKLLLYFRALGITFRNQYYELYQYSICSNSSRRQRRDIVVLAHIKEQSRLSLSLSIYGRP